MGDSYHSAFDKIKMSDEKKQEILQRAKECKSIHKSYSVQKICTIPAACIIVVCFFIFGPAKINANELFHELVGLIKVNRECIEIGSSEWLKIDMPEDVESLKYEGTVYKYKTYNELKSLEQDLGIELLDFGCEYRIRDGGVHFQVENNEAGSINMLLDPSDCENEGLPVSYTLYFSTAENVSTGQLDFNDKTQTYLNYGSNGEQIEFDFEEKFELVKRYTSSNLETDVLLVREKNNTKSEEREFSSTRYYAIFVYDKAEYQLCFNSDVDNIIRIIEQMK